MSRGFRAPVWIAAVIDVGLVVVFVLIGRASHDEGLSFGGVLTTLWPFLTGLAVGWLVTRAWRRPDGILWPGVALWVSVVVVGMLLRLAAEQGIAMAFIVVAAVVLGVFLVDWRAVWRASVRLRERRGA